MKRRLLEVLGIAVLSIVVTAALEIGLRISLRLLDGEWPRTRMASFYARIQGTFELYRPHAYLNTAPREGRSASAFGKQASFNTLGYRSAERPRAKPPGARRIVFAGGSTTFDLLAEKDELSWPWQVESLLAERGCAVESWNAGFPGWTSLENAVGLMLRDLDLEPDVVVLFQGINDLQPASSLPLDRHYENHASDARRALGFDLPPLGWADRLLVLERLRDLVAGPRDPWQRIGPSAAIAVERREEIEPQAVEVYGRNVGAFIALARASPARVVLVTQSLRLRPEHLAEDRRYLGGWVPGLEPEAAERELEKLNDVQRRIAAELSVPLLDAASDFPWRDSDFGDAMHFSADGSSRFAGYVAEGLVSLLGESVCAAAPSS